MGGHVFDPFAMNPYLAPVAQAFEELGPRERPPFDGNRIFGSGFAHLRAPPGRIPKHSGPSRDSRAKNGAGNYRREDTKAGIAGTKGLFAAAARCRRKSRPLFAVIKSKTFSHALP